MTAQTPPKPLPPIVVNLVFLGCFVGGLAIVIVALLGVVNEGALGAGAVAVEARVTDMRIMEYRRRGDSYELRYAFDVGDRTYTYRDETGREDLWAVITQEAWETARAKGTIEVRYLPSDPWVSEPTDRATEGVFDKLAGMCVGLLCMAPALLGIFAAVKRRLARA